MNTVWKLSPLDYANTYTLRQRRSDETMREDQRSPLLLKAAAEGQTLRTKYLLQLGVSLDYHDGDGLTALHQAVLSGFEDTAQTLIDAGCDVNSLSEKYGTPLCLAALKARDNVIRLLLQARASVSAPGGWLGSPLHCACSTGEIYTVELLLIAGAKPNAKRVVRRFQNGSVVDSVLQNTTWDMLDKFNERGQHNLDPLHIAVSTDEIGLAGMLLRHGAQVNGTQVEGPTLTPLSMAACLGSRNMITFLLDSGADIALLNGFDHSSALLCAVRSNAFRCAATLIQYGAPVDVQNIDGHTPLHIASGQASSDCLTLLIDAGASTNVRTDRGETALHVATRKGALEIVRALLAAGAEINTMDNHGRTPLDCLQKKYDPSKLGDAEIAHELARHGGQFSMTTNSFSLIRLLNINTLRFQEFALFESIIPTPKFITLSHMWAQDELSYQALQSVPAATRMHPQSFSLSMLASHRRLRDFLEQAKLENVEWVWTNAICIDYTNSREKERAIKSSMKWHDSAEAHFIYLRDLHPEHKLSVDRPWPLDYCAWLDRLWSLQGLLANASEKTLFFDIAWNRVGSRSSLASILCDRLRIKPEHLEHYKSACVATKLSWGSRLSAKIPEDRSYAMLDILGVEMELRYGEGEARAFRRLQEAIIENIDDESLFAWEDVNSYGYRCYRENKEFERWEPTDPAEYQDGWRPDYGNFKLPPYRQSGLLAPSIDCFRNCYKFDYCRHSSSNSSRRFVVDEGGMKIKGVRKQKFYRSKLDIILRCEWYLKEGKNCRHAEIRLVLNSQGIWRRVKIDHGNEFDLMFTTKSPPPYKEGDVILVPHDAPGDGAA